MTNDSTTSLKSFVERIERLEEEKKGIAADIGEIYQSAKAHGFDVKVMRQLVRLRKLSAQDRQEQEDLLATYMAALGMLAHTPLGQAALARVA